MASSLLSQIFELSTSSFFDKLSRGFGGDLVCGTGYGGSISILGISIIDFGILGPIPLLMMIGLDAEVPCYESKGGRSLLLTPALP